MKKQKIIIEKVKQTHPQLVRGIPDARLQKLVKAIFAAVGEDIAALEKGRLKVSGLGTFRVRTVEVEKDGEKKSSRRVRLAIRKPGSKPRKGKRKQVLPKSADTEVSAEDGTTTG
jgi:nucleoid DNA-binding protein